MSEATVKPRLRRADAQRNYDSILAAARVAVVERGADVSLEDVARDAGVGIGTLYRHFPTRLALFEATFIDEVEELRARAEALAEESTSFDALVTWLRLQLDLGAHGRCMGAAVMNAKHTEGSDMQVAYVSMRKAGDALLARAQAAGEARAGVEMPDVLRLIHGVVVASEQLADPVRATAMFDLIVAGIRA